MCLACQSTASNLISHPPPILRVLLPSLLMWLLLCLVPGPHQSYIQVFNFSVEYVTWWLGLGVWCWQRTFVILTYSELASFHSVEVRVIQCAYHMYVSQYIWTQRWDGTSSIYLTVTSTASLPILTPPPHSVSSYSRRDPLFHWSREWTPDWGDVSVSPPRAHVSHGTDLRYH